MSGGSTQQSTSTTSSPEWVQPYQMGYLDQAQQVASTPYQAYGGNTVADMNGLQSQAIQGIAQRATSGSADMNAGSQTLQNTLNGGYLNANPYLDSQINAAQGDVVRIYQNAIIPRLDQQRAQSGSFGNSGIQSAENEQARNLAQQLGNISTTMRGNNYATERQNQQAAMSLAPAYANQDYTDLNALQTAGNTLQQQNQNQITGNYQQWQNAQNYPKSQLDVMGNALSHSLGQQTTTTQPGVSTAAGVAGGALTGAQIYNLLFGG